MTQATRLMVFGFDAAAGDLVRRWAGEGELPVLQRLIGDGATTSLGSLAGYLPESIWASVNTGCAPGGHGHYNWRETRPGTYVRARRPLAGVRPPFWQVLRGAGAPADGVPRALLLDVHGAVDTGDPGIALVTGWGLRGLAPHEHDSVPA